MTLVVFLFLMQLHTFVMEGHRIFAVFYYLTKPHTRLRSDSYSLRFPLKGCVNLKKVYFFCAYVDAAPKYVRREVGKDEVAPRSGQIGGTL